MKRMLLGSFAIAGLILGLSVSHAAPGNNMIGINVLLKTSPTSALLADLATHGKVRDVVYEIRLVTLQARSSDLPIIRNLPYVATANPDATRSGAPIDGVPVSDFKDGMNTWDLDAINVTDFGAGRTEPLDGSGVYVAVIDTGLLDLWRVYLPQERIASQYAKSFGGGGGENGNVSEQPNKWEHDQNSHGTHVTSTILGYNIPGLYINGVAPKATVIPVKVLNQNGSGWSSVVARGIVYVADLKAGPLSGHPVVINMSLGGPDLDAAEKAAIDYAISKGVIVVASAGNGGTAGMGYPGAYPPVISVGASGWIHEWEGTPSWWLTRDVADPIDSEDFYITDFSSRELAGQDLDIVAPGSWVVGPYQLQSGKPSWFFLGGTSMASPHVTGTVALMAQKNPSLTAPQAEAILEGSAVPIAAGSQDVHNPDGSTSTFSWGDDATGAGLLDAEAAIAATP